VSVRHVQENLQPGQHGIVDDMAAVSTCRPPGSSVPVPWTVPVLTRTTPSWPMPGVIL